MKKVFWSNNRITIYSFLNVITTYSIYLSDGTYLDSTTSIDTVNSWIVSEKLIYNLYKVDELELNIAQ